MFVNPVKVLEVEAMLPVINVSFSPNFGASASPGQEAELKISLHRMSKEPSGIYAPKFPKRKEEAWWVILGDPNNRELLGLRRLALGKSTVTSLTFDAPTQPGEYTYYIYFMSDSYLGLDQQYKFKFNVVQNSDE